MLKCGRATSYRGRFHLVSKASKAVPGRIMMFSFRPRRGVNKQLVLIRGSVRSPVSPVVVVVVFNVLSPALRYAGGSIFFHGLNAGREVRNWAAWSGGVLTSWRDWNSWSSVEPRTVAGPGGPVGRAAAGSSSFLGLDLFGRR